MGKIVFVPLTDDLLYDHPERIHGPVIPFSQQARRAVAEHKSLRPTNPQSRYKNEVRNNGDKPDEPLKTRQSLIHTGRGTALG